MAAGVAEAEKLMAAMPVVAPTLDSLEAVVRIAENRVRRAAIKRAAADAEEADALRDLHAARKARADWIAGSAARDDQMLML